ncbi:MAG: class I SAM-dependent methyltransferase [Vicinamibacterales bacterium]|nr:class I SAM-dependent methyltransferase [Vicinamibacterales bacterium]
MPDPQPTATDLKAAVRTYWERESCGTHVAGSEKFTRAYFDEIERYRYAVEPEIFSFAQFTRHHGERLLEVGVGAGSDFLQWARAGCRVHGIDLTEEAIDHVRHRLAVYGFEAEDLRVADAEHLPYDDGTFDVVYSWGVIHHSPGTEQALREIVRVTRPGGTIKVMVYHRPSLNTWFRWLRFAALRGQPFRSLTWVMHHHLESPGTKAYTRAEFADMAARAGARITAIRTSATRYDLQFESRAIVRAVAYALACLVGWERCGFFLMAEMTRPPNGE